MFFYVPMKHLEIRVTGNPGTRRRLGASVALIKIDNQTLGACRLSMLAVDEAMMNHSSRNMKSWPSSGYDNTMCDVGCSRWMLALPPKIHKKIQPGVVWRCEDADAVLVQQYK